MHLRANPSVSLGGGLVRRVLFRRCFFGGNFLGGSFFRWGWLVHILNRGGRLVYVRGHAAATGTGADKKSAANRKSENLGLR